MTHLGLQQRPAVAPVAAVGAMHDDPLSRIESFSLVPLEDHFGQSGDRERQPRYLAGCMRGGGCPVNRGRVEHDGPRVREHGGWPRRTSSLARARPLAAQHLSSLSSRWSGNMPVSSDMRSGPVKRATSWTPCCEFKEGSSWTTPSTAERCGWADAVAAPERGRTGCPGQSSCRNAKLTRL